MSRPWHQLAAGLISLGVVLSLCLGAAPATALPSAATQQQLDTQRLDTQRLDTFVRRQMRRADIPGAAYAVVGRNGVEHENTFGSDGNGDPVTTSTPFLWGSVAKPVTATLLVLMADAGEIRLDAPVRTYLPSFRMADRRASAQITVRHLLSHTGGIPEMLRLTDRFDAGRRPGDVLEMLVHVPLESAPGAEHHYSSVNYLLLGAVVERVTGRPFAAVLSTRLLAPAEMDTAITTPAQATDRLPPGHRYVAQHAKAYVSDFDPAGTSYGYFGGSLDDAVAFARANLRGSDVLTKAQRDRLTHGEVTTGAARTYGLGWRTWKVFGAQAPMHWHAGAAPGYQASLILLPGQDRAVVVLQNVYGSFQENQLLDTSWGIASLLYDAEPELHEVDSLYVIVLVGLVAVCTALLAAAGASGWRVFRPVPRTRRRAVLGLACWLVAVGLAVTCLLSLPSAFGVARSQMTLWAPDIALLVHIAVVLALVVAALRVMVTVRSRTTPPDVPS